jgi:HD-GYP domain-containing protein (c-di-GMP phosphodiesterase class II)/NAD(P)-dependent dehydrogenase (short-subunit alcohol dehydrogenase family)
MPERAALVTGASSGIGLAIADVLGAEGHGLTVASRRPEKLAAAVEELRGKGYEVEEVAANLTVEEDVQRVVAVHRERFGRLDVLVNSAGVGVGAPVAEIQTKRADMQLDVNLRAIILFYRECVDLLLAAGAEHRNALVVNLSSISGKSGAAWLSVYSATKAAVVGWTQAMNQELNGGGVKSVALCPGFVDTPMTEFIRLVRRPGDRVPASGPGDLTGSAQSNAHTRVPSASTFDHALVGRAIEVSVSGNGDTVSSLRAQLDRTERQASARQRQLERYAADLREVFKQERNRAQELRDSYRATVRALSNAVEARDAYTGKHAERVTAYGIALARAVGLDTDRMPDLEFGFLLHDVGKVGVPDAILFKPGSLDESEFALIAQHPVIGSEILRDVEFLGDGKLVVRHHHERWDGTGYPDRLAGEAIPLAARVFAVADALDALTTDRPYRRGTRFARARDEIRSHAGSQFDPGVVAALETIPDARFAELRDGVA